MKKMLVGLFAAGLMGGLLGCELDENNEARELKFDNASEHTVKVSSLAGEFEKFNLAPEQHITLKDIKFPDYDWEPKSKVDVSSQSSSRIVTFVNAREEEEEEPTIIIITNQP